MTLTATDQFCGAGGTSIGAATAGVELKLALNHWQLAIETHASNFPDAGHDCADVSQTDPRRYPSTDILLTSPECTAHSYAGGRSNRTTNPRLFEDDKQRLARLEAERSRATMWDVVRFAEYHRYRLVIVENVVQARDWAPYKAWWQAMESLGYVGQALYLNSMFFPPTPQSRDRMYVVWRLKGQPAPDLDYRPPAVCVPCGELVEAVQSWKRPDRPWGRYGQQYVYRCPDCGGEVDPAYTPASVAIDWTDLGTRIGDRDRPLATSTMKRIRAGLDRYGLTSAAVQVGGNTFERDGYARYRPVDRVLFTQPGTNQSALLAVPFITELRRNGTARGVDDPMSTVTAGGNHHGLTIPPALVMRNNTGPGGWQTTSIDEALRTLTSAGHQSLIVPIANKAAAATGDQPLGTLTTRDRFALLVPSGGTWQEDARPLDGPLATLTTTEAWGLLMANRSNGVPRSVDEAMQTIATGNHHYLIVPTDRGTEPDSKRARPADEPLPTQTTRQTEALADITGIVDIDDCRFRMFQPREIGAGMAFPADYQVLGNKREKTKQYGNAVTPPVPAWIVTRCMQALEVAA